MNGWFERALALMLCGVALLGCGEIEQVQLAITPSPEDFNTEIQPLLIQIGCSLEGGCHDIGLGGVAIKLDTGAAALEESYLSVKAQLDFEAPGESRIIQSVLTENAQTTHSPGDCIDLDNCSYQKLVAWISWEKEGDLRPQDIDCDPSPEGCFK